EFAAEADLGGRAAVEAPAILILLLEAGIVRLLGLRMRDLAEPCAVLGHELGGKHVHANVLRPGYHLRAGAIALTRPYFDGEIPPPPLAQHVLQAGCRCRSAG